MNKMVEVARPFKQEPLDLPGGNLLKRTLTAKGIAMFNHTSPEAVAERLWSNDRTLAPVSKAASAPAMTSVTGWAAELARKRVADTVQALGAAAAAVELM